MLIFPRGDWCALLNHSMRYLLSNGFWNVSGLRVKIPQSFVFSDGNTLLSETMKQPPEKI